MKKESVALELGTLVKLVGTTKKLSQNANDDIKLVLDAYFGEILTTLEKLRFIIEEGEEALKPETRSQVTSCLGHETDCLRAEKV
jgi:hypothetical protein